MKKLASLVRIPSPRKEQEPAKGETPAEAFRRRLVARAPSTKELRRRISPPKD